MVVVVPRLLSFVFDEFAFRSQVSGVYLSVITQALAYVLMPAFFRKKMGLAAIIA